MRWNDSYISAEDRALERFANLMIERMKNLQHDWMQSWIAIGAMKWPRNMNGHPENQVDFNDIDNDGIPNEVVHVDNKEQPFEVSKEVAPFKFLR